MSMPIEIQQMYRMVLIDKSTSFFTVIAPSVVVYADSTVVVTRNFVPLDPAHDEELLRVCQMAEPDDKNHGFSFPGDESICEELKELGYLSYVSLYIGGGCAGAVSSKGLRYPADRAAWEERRNTWEEKRRIENEIEDKRRDAELAADRKHDWHLNIVNGVYSIVSVVIGGILGYFIGRI